MSRALAAILLALCGGCSAERQTALPPGCADACPQDSWCDPPRITCADGRQPDGTMPVGGGRADLQNLPATQQQQAMQQQLYR